LRHINRQIQ